MFGFIVGFAVVFGVIMGAREAIASARGGAAVADARFAGIFVGFIFGLIAFIGLMGVWGAGAAYWWLINL